MDILLYNTEFHIGVLTTLLFIAGICDKMTMKIPNILILVGFILGFIYQPSLEEILLKVFYVIFLFAFSMLGMLGFGDIKLFMVIALFLNITNCMIITFFAAIGSIIYSIVKYKETARFYFSSFALSLYFKQKYVNRSNIYLPFGPFIFMGYAALIIIWEVVNIA